MDFFSKVQIGLAPLAEEQVLAGMRLAAIVAHKALVLVHLTDFEMKSLLASVDCREMSGFAADLREVQRSMINLCEVLGAAERRISENQGRTDDVIN